MNLLSRPGIFTTTIASVLPPQWAPEDLSSFVEQSREGDPWVSADEAVLGSESDDSPDSVPTGPDPEELARLQIEARIEDAFATGYEEGRLAGEIAEGVRLRNAVKAAERALDEIREGEARWQSAVHENIAALAVAIARHIVGRELHSDADAVADLVRRALAEFPIDQPMRVRVNPHDLSLLASHGSSCGGPLAIAPNRDVRWQADPRLTPGGCIVEGRERIIDGRVDTALERLYRRLTYTNA